MFIQLSTIWITLFTEMEPNQDVKFIYGWWMIGFITFMTLSNLLLVFQENFKKLYLIFMKYMNITDKSVDCCEKNSK
jgi:hypothetical protein